MDAGSPAKSAPDLPPPTTDPQIIERRRFFTRLSMTLSAIIAAIMGVPFLGFLFAPLASKGPRVWRPVGNLDGFRVGETVSVIFEDASPVPWSGVTARTAAYLRRESDNEFIAFAVNCTHLGCPVQWFSDANLFLCPCHGGVYYADGAVAAGPPPEPLPRYPVRVRNGQVEIQTTPTPIT